ncbi:MAG: hypothetical protein IKK17_03980, partial [Oscillospiraceae bacterium]|nr:hypothetical protein [Oscillospiraceae bacterium]
IKVHLPHSSSVICPQTNENFAKTYITVVCVQMPPSPRGKVYALSYNPYFLTHCNPPLNEEDFLLVASIVLERQLLQFGE